MVGTNAGSSSEPRGNFRNPSPSRPPLALCVTGGDTSQSTNVGDDFLRPRSANTSPAPERGREMQLDMLTHPVSTGDSAEEAASVTSGIHTSFPFAPSGKEPSSVVLAQQAPSQYATPPAVVCPNYPGGDMHCISSRISSSRLTTSVPERRPCDEIVPTGAGSESCTERDACSDSDTFDLYTGVLFHRELENTNITSSEEENAAETRGHGLEWLPVALDPKRNHCPQCGEFTTVLNSTNQILNTVDKSYFGKWPELSQDVFARILVLLNTEGFRKTRWGQALHLFRPTPIAIQDVAEVFSLTYR